MTCKEFVTQHLQTCTVTFPPQHPRCRAAAPSMASRTLHGVVELTGDEFSDSEIRPPLKRVPAKPATVNIDDEGDLILSVGELTPSGRMDFKVCSAALRRASPIFKSMLFGGWLESRPRKRKRDSEDDDWIVSLPEDEPWALEPVLYIAHGDFQLLSGLRQTSIEHIYSILIVSRKYDFGKVIAPCANDWRLKMQYKDTYPCREPMKFLAMSASIAYELGDEELFKKYAVVIITDAAESEDRHIISEDGDIDLTVLEHFGPVDFAGKLKITHLRVRVAG